MSSLLFFLSFAFYLSGLSGTVPPYRDSGDLIASIHTLGIAHPPGYAAYVLLGKLFVTILPVGNVAYRVNMMSAFFAAMAIALLYRILRKTTAESTPIVPAVISILFATSPAVVALSHAAEMYTLAAFFAAAILFCLLRDSPRFFSLAAFLLGLGLSVHPTLILLAPVFFVSPPRPLPRSSMLFFLLGLSVFLYLPIRASQHPLVNWGDPSNWRNFWRVVTRADYGGLKLHPEQSTFAWNVSGTWAQLKYFAAALKGEWGWAALVIGSLGIFSGIKVRAMRRLTAALLGAWLLSGPAFFLLSNLPLDEATTPAILQPYLLLTGLLWAPFVIGGCDWILRQWPRRMTAWGTTVMALFVTACLLGTRSWAWTSQRYHFYTYDYARNLLRSLPQDAVLYDPDDPTHFSIQVLQTVEQRRRDVVLLSFFRTRWGYEQMKRRWPDLLPPVPIKSGPELQRLLWTYSAHRKPFFAELPQKFGTVPYRPQGLVYAAQTGAFPISATESRSRAEALLEIYVKRGDLVTTHHPDFFTRHVLGYYAAAHCNLGLDYANAKKWEEAIRHYQAALAIDPELSAAYNNLGIVAFEHRDYSKAHDMFQKGLAREPKNENLRKNAELALQKMGKLL